jgi:hypothetical protein
LETTILRLFLLRPYRCRQCNWREYAPVWRLPYGARKLPMKHAHSLQPATLRVLALLLIWPLLLLADRSLLRRAGPSASVAGSESAAPEPRRRLVMPAAAEVRAEVAGTPAWPGRFLTPVDRSGQAPAPQSSEALGSLRATGEVFVNNNPVTADLTVFAGDSLRTGANGTANLLVTGRGTLTVLPQSQVAFPSDQRFFASLQRGQIQLSAMQGATRLQIQIGGFLVVPSTETAAEALIESLADGRATVTALRGTIGVIALEGPAAQFLTAGQQARISATGEISLAGQAAAQQQPPVAPAPGGPSVEKKPNRTPYILLGVGGGAAAAAAVALAGKKESQPVSPFRP